MTRISPIGSRGFTLLELIIAMVIGSLVMAALYGAFNTAIKAQKSMERTLTPLRDARYVFTFFKKDAAKFRSSNTGDILSCSGLECQFPILTQEGEKGWVKYEFDEKQGLNRIVNIKEKILKTTLSRNIKDAVFQSKTKSNKHRKNTALLVNIVLSFGNNAYSQNILFEILPD
ncbi:MAG: prepilin-type N-terminal cleavage/methylation domain-containing protein [Desulfobacterales bacterium]|nr:prepilin-type N-terminal cleavage/methylation domain-containing protein [Desulfobacterales bacterium]